MKTDDKALKKDKNSDNKPVQEALPTSKQVAQGDANDLEKNEEYAKEKDDNTNNSVGIKKKEGK